jgi:putative flavoprotein involved in K+ transport
VEIAIELAKSRHTLISGHPTFHIPDPVFRYAGRFYWWFASNILTVRTPIGRKAKKSIVKGGGPLINVSVKDFVAAEHYLTSPDQKSSDSRPALLSEALLRIDGTTEITVL